MARATTAVEKAGVPAVAIVCHGFTAIAQTVARFEGLSDIRLITYPPPNISVQHPPDVTQRAGQLVDEIIHQLSRSLSGQRELEQEVITDYDIVLKGDLEEVNRSFYLNQWTDGLPVVPPTIKAVKEFLKYTDRPPDEIIGVLPPGKCSASIWKIAVNGVVAGCRPEYMPVLVAVTEAIAEPRFGLQHAGSTAGWTPLVVINGPIIRELDFNYGQGVLRPERQANITVSRFLRLLMVNIAKFRLGQTDMAAFGNNYIPVLAEAEQDSPWAPLSTDLGYKPGTNLVTVLSSIGTGYHFIVRGDAKEHLKVFTQEVIRTLGSQMAYVLTTFGPEWHPVFAMTPLVASILYKAGYSKNDVKKYLYDNARLPAHSFEDMLQQEISGLTVQKAAEQYSLPPDFHTDNDPNQLLPLFHNPDELFIVVSGMPQRNRAFVMAQIGHQGLATSKEIKLPEEWQRLLQGAKK